MHSDSYEGNGFGADFDPEIGDDAFEGNGARSPNPPSDAPLRRLASELRAAEQIEPSAIAAMLEDVAAEAPENAHPEYLILCLQELIGWADYAIVQLKKSLR